MGLKILGRTALGFFGRMTASVSHELKNVFAVINENAGLMEDLIALSERGRPLDAKRLALLASKTREQVKRGDQIVKNLNLFAHSVDRDKAPVSLSELLTLSTALAARLATNKGYEIVTQCDRNIPELTTSPFLLHNLLWRALDYAMQDTDEEKKIVIFVNDAGDELHIGLKRSPFKDADAGFPGEAEHCLAEALGAGLDVMPSLGTMLIKLRK